MKPLVGQPIVRREDVRYLKGRAQYVDDLHRDGMLHAAILRSSWAHGRLLRIDTSAAASAPGVIGVFTHLDFGDLKLIPSRVMAMPNMDKLLQRAIASDKVRYVGEPIAVVVAGDPYLAEDALALIDVEVEQLPVIAGWDSAVEATSLLHEDAASNVSTIEVGRGDAESAFKAAAYRRKERFTFQRHTAIPMETRGIVADWDAGNEQLTVWGSTKAPFANRGILASMLGLPEKSVVMKLTDVGGAFGVRGEFHPEDFLIPCLARRLGRPLKWIEDRREHFLATNHARETVCDLEIACERDGTVIGLRATVMGDVGAYVRGTGAVAPTRIAQYLPGPYRIPNFACAVNVFVSNKVPCCTYRGPGRVEANFFRERLLDMAARDLGIDAAQMRRKNLVTPAEMPFELGDLVTYPPTSAALDSGDYAATFDEALREIGWAEKREMQGRCIDGWYHGVGFGCFAEGSAGGPNEHARLRLASDGTIDLFVGATSSGQGHETVFAQICADEMQLEMDRIRVIDASTDELVSSIGTFNSRSTMMAGNAVRIASQTFKTKLRDLALDYLNRPNVPVEWRDGAFRTHEPGVRVILAELARFAQARGETVDITDAFQDKGIKPFSYGTHAAHVAVDVRTGRIRLVDFIAVEDIGRVINPLLAHGQAMGAIVQGLGGTFLEHLQYDEEGQLLTASLADYLMPTASDFPNIRSTFLDLARAPGNPLGVKGAGEGGIVAVSAAVGNAVSAALSSFGVEVRDLPLTPPRVWQMIAKARG